MNNEQEQYTSKLKLNLLRVVVADFATPTPSPGNCDSINSTPNISCSQFQASLSKQQKRLTHSSSAKPSYFFKHALIDFRRTFGLKIK